MKNEMPGRAVKAYVASTPVLWLLGLLLPATILLLLYLIWRARASRLLTDAVAIPWYLVAACQGLSVTVNWWQGGLPLQYLLYRLASTGVTGWLVMGLVLGAGRRLRLASPLVVRAGVIQGANFLWLGVLCFVLAMVVQLPPPLSFESPMATLVPDSFPGRAFYFVLRFYLEPDLVGSTPRLVLFYPWSSMLGFAAVATLFISTNEPSRLWRMLGYCGGLTALVGSQSRGPLACMALGVVAYALVKVARPIKLRVAVVATLVCIVGLLLSEPGRQVLGAGADLVHSVRLDSSDARLLGYQESWAAFLRSPVLGYGWPGDDVDKTIPMGLGTHSSVYGLLYTGGALTFGAFCYALASLVFHLCRRAISTSDGIARAGFAISVAMVVLSYGEGLYSFALPLVVVFAFLGGCLAVADRTNHPEQERLLSP